MDQVVILPMDTSIFLDKSFQMYISIMESYQEMYFHFYHMKQTLIDLQNDMTTQYRYSVSNSHKLEDIKVGGCYAAEGIFGWSRVQVIKITRSETFQVFCVDYGCKCYIERAGLRKLIPELAETPRLTFKSRFHKIPHGLEEFKARMSQFLLRNNETIVTFMEFDSEGTATVLVTKEGRDVFDIISDEIQKERTSSSMPALKRPPKSETPAPTTHEYDIPDLVESPGLTFSPPTDSQNSILEDERTSNCTPDPAEGASPYATPRTVLPPFEPTNARDSFGFNPVTPLPFPSTHQSATANCAPLQYHQYTTSSTVLPPVGPTPVPDSCGFKPVTSPPLIPLGPPQPQNVNNMMVPSMFFNPYAMQLNMMNQLKMHAQQYLYLWNCFTSGMPQYAGVPIIPYGNGAQFMPYQYPYSSTQQVFYPPMAPPQANFVAPQEIASTVSSPPTPTNPETPQQFSTEKSSNEIKQATPTLSEISESETKVTKQSEVSPAGSEYCDGAKSLSSVDSIVACFSSSLSENSNETKEVPNVSTKETLRKSSAADPRQCYHPGVTSCLLCATSEVPHAECSAPSKTFVDSSALRKDSPPQQCIQQIVTCTHTHCCTNLSAMSSKGAFGTTHPTSLPVVPQKHAATKSTQQQPIRSSEAPTVHQINACPQATSLHSKFDSSQGGDTTTGDVPGTEESFIHFQSVRCGFPPENAFRYPPPPVSSEQSLHGDGFFSAHSSLSCLDKSPSISFFDESYGIKSLSSCESDEQNEGSTNSTIAASQGDDGSVSIGMDAELVEDFSDINKIFPSLTLLTDGSEGESTDSCSSISLPDHLPPVSFEWEN